MPVPGSRHKVSTVTAGSDKHAPAWCQEPAGEPLTSHTGSPDTSPDGISNVFWIFVKAFSPADCVLLPPSPPRTSFQRAVSATYISPPFSAGPEVDGVTHHPASSMESPRTPQCQWVVSPLAVGLSLLLYKGHPQKFSMRGYMKQSWGPQIDSPMGRTTWKTPTDLLRAVVPNPIVPHSHKRAKKSSLKPAFTTNCRRIWDRLSLVTGCQLAAGRDGRGHNGKALRWELDKLEDGEGKRFSVIHLYFLQE